MAVDVCDRSTQEAEAEDHGFQASTEYHETAGKKNGGPCGRDKRAPSGLLYKVLGDTCEVLPSWSRNFSKAPPSNVISLKVRILKYKF